MDGESSRVLVVDTQRLRADAVCEALRLQGIDATVVPTTSGLALAVVHRDASVEPGVAAGLPYLLLGAPPTGPRSSADRGALAVIPPTEPLSTVAAAVRAALSGGRVTASTGRPRAAPAPETDRALLQRLSERERMVLGRLALGSSNQTIAADLDISANTVRTHVQNILAKLEVGNRHAAVSLARRGGLLVADDAT